MPYLEQQSIRLPKSATIADMAIYRMRLEESAGIVNHNYLRLEIDPSRRPINPIDKGPRIYRIDRIVLTCTSPLTYRTKNRAILAPKDKDFEVSIDTLRKKISELEDFYQSELKAKEKKTQLSQQSKDFCNECKRIGLPMMLDEPLGSHFFSVANNGIRDLTVTISRQFNPEQAIALHHFLQDLDENNIDEINSER